MLIVLSANSLAQEEHDTTDVQQQLKIFMREVDSLKLDRRLFALPKKSYLEMGVGYLSNNVYMGRKDSSVLPYIIPSLSYFHKSGLFMSASAAYLQNSTNSRFDLETFELGYMFFTPRYQGSFSAVKYFYNSQSTNVTSEIEASLTYQNGYDFGFIRPTLTATANFSNQADFMASFGLEHRFYLFHDRLDITPEFVANASTQNYYNDYYENKRYAVKRNEKKETTAIKTMTGKVLDASTFKILDYEASVSLYYTAGKFTFYCIPTYAIPVHPAMLSIHEVSFTGGARNYIASEEIENSFFCMLGAYYRF